MAFRRVQMSRQHPWRADHPDAIRVDRSTRWGNPFSIKEYGSRAAAVDAYREAFEAGTLAVTVEEIRENLAGHDLACWCPLDGPCHADILLRVANT
ncbi:DUF4326 domain-containing protein [Actinoplanes sp. NPDC051513]|uniref:DUF4326 domain-containing protein n=1 Tax=Actinoplanes sp. NPDC051513 TaxID=3363908 RepID=UPI0037953C1E